MLLRLPFLLRRLEIAMHALLWCSRIYFTYNANKVLQVRLCCLNSQSYNFCSWHLHGQIQLLVLLFFSLVYLLTIYCWGLCYQCTKVVMKSLDTTSVGGELVEKEFIHNDYWDCSLVQSLWKAERRFLKEVRIELPHDQQFLLLFF